VYAASQKILEQRGIAAPAALTIMYSLPFVEYERSLIDSQKFQLLTKKMTLNYEKSNF
jgi:hypothetical protein